jgi:MEDS: MEthanogen/methylotroph, DcmR Sensory domain
MIEQLAPLISEEVGLGDHAAFFFKSNSERLDYVIPYVVKGLKRNERCVYIAEENTVPDILAELKRAGVEVGHATTTGALSVITKHDAYLRHGIFEPERMIADLDRDVRFALQIGYAGLRVTGEMSWALDLPFALGRLCQYEEELRRAWPDRLGGLCQYNESLFPADVVERMAGCHGVVIRDGNITRQPASDHDHA